MSCAWSGTFAQLKQLHQTGSLTDQIATGFRAAFQKPSDTEMDAWRFSLAQLLAVLSSSDFEALQVIIELARERPANLEIDKVKPLP